MKELLVVVAVFALSYAQDGGNKCNYPATGSETLQNAVPIKTFHTSGLDFVRPAWCITHCKDRKSIKAAMDFQAADSARKLTPFLPQEATFKVQSYSMPGEKRVVEAYTKEGQRADDDDFCVDPDVSAIADQVFQQYTDVETIAEALNYMVNKTGWAYLVYEMGPPPSVVSTWNLHQDPNFCMKSYYTQDSNGNTRDYDMFAGLVKN
ncbi:hypothetical protein COOONC_06305 [Cooperia oncophora]